MGAHRSGTSALTHALEELGVFAGCHQDPNREARFFQGLNEWFLKQTAATWDRPEAFAKMLTSPSVRELAVDYLRLVVRSPRTFGYLGVRKFLRYRRLEGIEVPWGWKDPRNCFTLPLWLEVFPEARVLHIHRHGVDVADSLCSRQLRSVAASRRRYARNRPLLRLLRKGAGFGDSLRCTTLMGAFEVWEAYMREAKRQVAMLGEHAIELSYEELVSDPRGCLERVARSCGLETGVRTLERAAARINPKQAAAHDRDGQLARFAADVDERVEALRAPRPAAAGGARPGSLDLSSCPS